MLNNLNDEIIESLTFDGSDQETDDQDNEQQDLVEELITYTKNEFINDLADQLESTKREATTILNSITSIIIAKVQTNHKVLISGLGNFYKKKSPERIKHNPHTNEKILLPAKNKIVFKAAKNFKDAIGLTE